MNDTLEKRFDDLDGCAGVWILDLRDASNRGYDLHYLPGYVPGAGTLSVKDALQLCIDRRWRDCRLLFSPERLNADCSWPGGYDAPSHYRSNNRVFQDEFQTELERADGDADGLALDIRFVTDEMVETIHALEDYPVLDESDHGDLEMEDQSEAWTSWVERDWRRAVESKLDSLLDDSETRDADEILDSIPDVDEKLSELFHACAEQSNTHWIEENQSGWWIDVNTIAGALDSADLRDLVSG